MKTITYETETGHVTRIGYRDASVPEPRVAGLTAEAVEAIPECPEMAAGTEPVLYRLEDGTLEWRAEAIPPTPEPPEPGPKSREEVRAARQEAYRATVDPLTAEISRLRDMAPEDPRIAEAEAEREAAVAAVIAANPYPEEEETP